MVQDTVIRNDVAAISLAEDEKELRGILEGLGQLEQMPPVLLTTAVGDEDTDAAVEVGN